MFVSIKLLLSQIYMLKFEESIANGLKVKSSWYNFNHSLRFCDRSAVSQTRGSVKTVCSQLSIKGSYTNEIIIIIITASVFNRVKRDRLIVSVFDF